MLAKVISNSKSWAAGGKFKGFGVGNPGSNSGFSWLCDPPGRVCPMNRQSTGFLMGDMRLCWQNARLVGSQKCVPDVGTEAFEGPYRSPAGSPVASPGYSGCPPVGGAALW